MLLFKWEFLMRLTTGSLQAYKTQFVRESLHFQAYTVNVRAAAHSTIVDRFDNVIGAWTLGRPSYNSDFDPNDNAYTVFSLAYGVTSSVVGDDTLIPEDSFATVYVG